MVGGGQLARMTQEAALALGVGLRVLAGGPTESAARAGGDVRWGAHDDPDAVAAFAVGCDVVTFDHEHVPQPILESLVRSGVPVRPGPAALAHAQDKVHMRAAISDAGVPCPAWAVVADAADVDGFAAEHGWPVVLKVSRGGYDGRGVWVVDGPAMAAEVLGTNPLRPGVQWLVEQHVPFTRELAAQVARSPSGQVAVYPVVRTVQTGGICTEVVAPCPELSDEHALAAQQVALRIAEHLDVVGMLAVELFDQRVPGGWGRRGGLRVRRPVLRSGVLPEIHLGRVRTGRALLIPERRLLERRLRLLLAGRRPGPGLAGDPLLGLRAP